jgi:aerobactin synthase
VRNPHWRSAGRALLAKALAELAYEGLITLSAVGGDGQPPGAPGLHYLALPGGVTYVFAARPGPCGWWRIDGATVRRVLGGRSEPADDPRRFLTDVADTLGLSGAVTADAVQELLATHTADARLAATARTAAELAELSYAELETHLGGHPGMVANKGRLGFSARDRDRYAPEARRPFPVRWAAVHPELASFHALPGLSSAALLDGELDGASRLRFTAQLAARADAPPGAGASGGSGGPGGAGGRGTGDPSGYVWLPVHPWQWDNVVEPLYAAEIATGRLVPLGESLDRYLPLQSVRTLVNVDSPGRRDVKLSLMIRNTLVWRGLSDADAAAAPDVTRWLADIRDADPFLREECRVVLAGEVAAAAVPHPVLGGVPGSPYRFHEMLGAIWREPLAAVLERGEKARSLASTLLVGRDGRALAAELVARSGLAADEWLRRLCHALLPPVLHYLYRYGVAFTPHGENVTVVFDARDVPVRIALKDFGADIELTDPALPEQADLPPRASRLLRRWPASDIAHSVLSALFAGHLRFLSALAEDHLGVPQPRFWALVREEVLAYQAGRPDLADRFTLFDLLAPRFGRVCLNREHLLGGGFHERADRDAGFDLVDGTVPNPLWITSDGPEGWGAASNGSGPPAHTGAASSAPGLVP